MSPIAATPGVASRSSVRIRCLIPLPPISAPLSAEPGYHEPSGLWLYGNTWLLRGNLVHIEAACGYPSHGPQELKETEEEAERLVLESKILVCGIHSPAHERVAVVPLRWGCPRIVVFSGGFKHHLGENLSDEPFRMARLWRYQWDPKTDLAVSRRAPDKKPTFARHNPTVDRLIQLLAHGQWPAMDTIPTE